MLKGHHGLDSPRGQPLIFNFPVQLNHKTDLGLKMYLKFSDN